MTLGLSPPRVSWSHKGSISLSMVVADGVMPAPPCKGAAADCKMDFHHVYVVELMPPTVPVPKSDTRACKPLIWFGAVPSEYISTEKLLAAVRMALRNLALARLMMRSFPAFERSSKPEAVTWTAACFQSNFAA